ncbi:3-hydroxyisobutyrate dehydrogenase [Corynebacterium ammoniagenes]|uniref:3-hydroxyisobutyrate dehydrogenase n=1 Tax=Corynebacterium ammoniagenes TaxID=1697 RepID=A0AAV5G6F9_CORAM|nr:3-hydroxyisobutyrate dehydrogenase [Corynebacterium ammoniagenes]NMF31870.1 3-hydroxyisobutyrate dehydrogenase [Corynebacterium ammoniagenes]GJN41907.1 3-hydroxyisobutyrate dehydrogenase [Corynebacterium ammoniagenes]
MSNQTIAVIGLGNMGGRMAANLAKAGLTVQGFDVSAEAKESSKKDGVAVFDTAVEAAEGAEVVITMLPNGDLVKKVLGELLDADSTAKVYIDSSTISVQDAREIGESVYDRGSQFIDAPVSGGTTGAEAGTLAFMVGGTEEAFNQVHPVLDVMGRSITHCGQVGNGQAVKACNNMILAVQQMVLSEAIVLGERLGLDHQAFFDVVSNATGNSWSLSVNAPIPDVVPTSPANNDFQPGFSSALMLKDLRLAMESAQATDTDTVLGKIATQAFEEFVAAGNGNLDFSAVINEVRR